ncbi:GPI inositol-deacylase isoform X1 [Salmo trutta]|uniref:GPI inositol-deacylase isoform X1 n=2 Tax=Salmo trutta TaxID=8032 RepID=UPI0011328232|nr:GPI inositol-deacylase isoform X1 [Salmo trutta]
MRVATVAFYGCALGLLAMGLREMFSGFEENRCTMTYMFEYPEYRRIALPRRVARQYPAYGLYLYGEGQYAQDTRGLKLTGAPVLFLPGNAGSYKQARSLGSVALRKAEALEGGVHLNVFTIDFNEELVALYGGSLRRQTHFLHESIKAILRLYKDHEAPPHSVVLVGHSMGGVVARALFTLPRFSPRLVSLIITQASPHQAPVLSLDTHLLEFYSAVRQRWVGRAEDLRNVTVLSVGGGYRDYQVRSGLTALPCPQDDPSKLSLVVTAVPRTWVSTDHLSIVWCKELVLATVRAFFDLIEPETGQFSDDPERRMAILNHHFIRHPVRVLGEQLETPVSLSGSPKTWSEVNTLRLAYSAPKEGQAKYFLFALSSRRRAYSHFYCRSNNLSLQQEMTSWVYGCTQMNGSMCVQAVDLSFGTELLPAYKVLTLSLSELSSVSHLIVVASNLNGRQFTVECEWQRQESQTISVPVPHVLSFGMSVSDVTLNSTGLRHTIELQHFHQVYQAFRISVVSHCKVTKADRLPNVYIMKVPWFREDSVTTSSIPSVTEISGMLHTSRPDNSAGVLLQLHTAPNCHYKVSVRTSFPRVLGQVLRFCGPVLPVYVAVALLLACGGQMSSVVRMGRPLQMSHAVARSLQPHKVDLPVYLLHLLLRYSWFQDGWSTLHLPPLDALPATSPDGTTQEGLPLNEDWPRLLSPLLYVLGAAMAFWGSVLLRLFLRLLSLLLAPLHRPSVSRDCGTLHRRTQLLLILCLSVLGWASCGALSITATFLLHLYRVLRLQMTERSLSHMLNLAPEKQTDKDNGTGNKERGTGEKERGTGEKERGTGEKERGTGEKERGTGEKERGTGEKERGTGEKERGTGEKERGTGEKERGTGNSEVLDSKPKECNGAPLLSDSVLQDVRDDLQLHVSLSALLTLPVMLCAPSLIHWTRNLRYSVARLDPDPCWPHSLPLFIASLLLINCNTLTLSYSKTLPITSRLLLPLSVAMVTFSPLHLYRVNYFVSAALVPLAVSCLF